MLRRLTLLMLALALWGCPGQRPDPPPPGDVAKPPPEAPTPVAPRPRRAPDPLDKRGSFDFDGVPLPQVIGALAKDHGLSVGVAPSVPLKLWSTHKVTLRLRDATRRAFLDWLVRPLDAEYALEGGDRLWITRDDDLLLSDPLVLHTYAVPTHVHTTRPLRGRLSFAKEQRIIIRTLEAGLRYLLDRRKDCALAFHGDHDLLVARLPAAGHRRLRDVLHAMRFGTDEPEALEPTSQTLRAALQDTVTCQGSALGLKELLAQLSSQTKINFGWDAARLGNPVVAVPKGERPLADVLRAIVAQTQVSRHGLEPGRGIWLYPKAQEAAYPGSGATLWDRSIVRAYDVRTLLRRVKPRDLLRHLEQHVDPGQWDRGFPSGDVFTPTGRLIVVHERAGQRRVAAVLERMMAGELPTPEPPKEPAEEPELRGPGRP